MADTITKGDLGQAMIMADILKRGYKVAIMMLPRINVIMSLHKCLERKAEP